MPPAPRPSSLRPALLVLGLLAAGCTAGSTATGTGSTTSTAGAATTTGVQPSTTTLLEPASLEPAPATFEMEVLRKVRLVNSDLPAGYAFSLIDHGEETTGQVTLDICSGEFPSEETRTGRLQQVALRSGQETLISNENVTYLSPEDASKALQQVRDAVASCTTNRFVPARVQGFPALKYDLALVAASLLGTVTSDHVAIEGTATDEAGRTYPQAHVFQRRGNVLIGVYGRDLTTIRPFLRVVAQRLEALSPGEAGE